MEGRTGSRQKGRREFIRGGRLCQRVPWQADPHGRAQRDPDPLPGIHGEAAPESSLCPADRGLAKSDAHAELCLREVAPDAGVANVGAETDELLTAGTQGVLGELGAYARRHSRRMLAGGTCLRLTSRTGGGPVAAQPVCDPIGRVGARNSCRMHRSDDRRAVRRCDDRRRKA